jgi:hypothetical protein
MDISGKLQVYPGVIEREGKFTVGGVRKKSRGEAHESAGQGQDGYDSRAAKLYDRVLQVIERFGSA